MASYLPPGSPFFPPPPPHPTRFRQLYQPMIWQQLSPTTSGNNTTSTSPGVMVGIGIGVVAFFLVVILLCRYRNSRANAEAHAAAAAVATRLQAPPQPDYWANDEQWLHRRRSDDRDDDDGRTQRASPTAGLPSFTYNRAVRHNNVTGSGDEAATCSVCLGAFQAGETVRLLPVCLHLYHVECIDPWLEAHSTCPLCRSGTDDDPMMQGGMLPTV